jgi:ribosomal protein S18 acetylase RimI-like enzyme
MLEALIARAREDGFRRLSLSVENDNPAIGLYESFGFRTVDQRGQSSTMVAEL